MNKIKPDINTLFNPKSIAVIGASNRSDKLGFHVMKSLITGGYSGKIIPINPKSKKIMGREAFPSIKVIQDPIDMAIIVLPADQAPDLLRECAEKSVRGIIMITAGFKEIDDPAGAELHDEIASIANRAGMLVIGPNTFGIANFHSDLNASFSPELSSLKRGEISLVSQSGGISALISYMAMKMEMGFSKIVGLGNRLNVDFAQMVEYLMDDPNTGVIILYLEGIDEPRDLLQKADESRGKKPILVFKAGSAGIANQASLSHTGSLAGRNEIYYGAFRQNGMLCIDDMETLLDTARALVACPIPEGPRVAILSCQAGPAMVATDHCDANGLKIASFNNTTQKKINEILPPLTLRTNPVDMGPAWYYPKAIKGIVQAVMEDTGIDGILFLMMLASANIDVVSSLTNLFNNYEQKKPVIGCIQSPPKIWDKQLKALEESRSLVNCPTPERAAKVMINLSKYGAMITSQ